MCVRELDGLERKRRERWGKWSASKSGRGCRGEGSGGREVSGEIWVGSGKTGRESER